MLTFLYLLVSERIKQQRLLRTQNRSIHFRQQQQHHRGFFFKFSPAKYVQLISLIPFKCQTCLILFSSLIDLLVSFYHYFIKFSDTIYKLASFISMINASFIYFEPFFSLNSFIILATFTSLVPFSSV